MTDVNVLRFLFFCTLFATTLFAQNSLDDYIQIGIKSNLALQQKHFAVERAQLALKTANSYFLPSITMHADYTSGEGGRAISIPVGDMLNPVYSTLNALTATNSFPQIKNVSQDFLPFQFYDSKVRTAMPLVNTDLIFNKKIQEGLRKIQLLDEDRYKQDLIKEIKIAYANFLTAHAACNIYQSTMQLALEAYRVNESLLKNGSGLAVYLVRSENEIEQIKAKQLEAETKRNSAKMYFNFLLNRDLAEEIKVFSLEPASGFEGGLGTKPEILQLQTALTVQGYSLSMEKWKWAPKINAFMDFGAQDKLTRFDKQSKYYLFGVMMELPLFEGLRGNYRKEEAELGISEQQNKLQQVSRQLELAVEMAKDKVRSAEQSYISAEKQRQFAQSYNNLVSKGYKAGQNSFIESLDGRTQLMNAELNLEICRNQLFAAKAELQRELYLTNMNGSDE